MEKPLDRWLERLPVRLTIFLLLALAGYGYSIFGCVRCGGSTSDWQFFQFYDEIARQAFLRWFQFPIWNPYQCGGAPFIGNPQTTFLVPTFPLVLVFGTTLGERLSNIAVIVVAAEGGWRLGRYLGMRPIAALLLGLTYPYFGRTMGWFHDGQYGLLGMGLSLWVTYGFLRGIAEPKYRALGAFFLAWMICFRGIQPGPQLALGLGLWAVLLGVRAYRENKSWRAALAPVGSLATIGVFAIALAGIRMIPVLSEVLSRPRVVNENTSRLLSDAWVHFYGLSPLLLPWYRDAGYAYIGIIPYLFAVGAFFVPSVRQRAAIPLVLFSIFAIVTMGYHGWFSIYPWLKLLPLYRSLRNPALYSFTGALFLCIAACWSFDRFLGWLEQRFPTRPRLVERLPIVLILVTVIELAATANWYMRGATFAYPEIPHVEGEFRQTRGNRFDVAVWPYIDRGSLSCYDETPWGGSVRLRPDLPAEEYLEDPSAGTARRVEWTPQRLVVEVELSRPTRLLVNQNWAPGWRSSTGTVVSLEGLLAVELPAGKHRVTLRMLPTLFFVGVLCSILALITLVRLWRGQRPFEAAASPPPNATEAGH